MWGVNITKTQAPCWGACIGRAAHRGVFLAGVGKVSPQRVVWADTWMEDAILCCLWKECARNHRVDS